MSQPSAISLYADLQALLDRAARLVGSEHPDATAGVWASIRTEEAKLLARAVAEHPIVKLAQSIVASHEIDPMRLPALLSDMRHHASVAEAVSRQQTGPALLAITEQLNRVAVALEAFQDVDPVQTSFGPVDLNTGRGLAPVPTGTLAGLAGVLGIRPGHLEPPVGPNTRLVNPFHSPAAATNRYGDGDDGGTSSWPADEAPTPPSGPGDAP